MFKPVVGILVGGSSSRMGGEPKGLIKLATGETIIERTLRITQEAGLDAVLVGDLDVYDAVAKVPRIPDATIVKGPLAGLQALLDHADEQSAIAIGCDMPFLTSALLQRLATESPNATVFAPRSTESDKWEPLCARYASSVRPILSHAIEDGDRSFQQLFKRLHVTELSLSDRERNTTIDWDTPEDMSAFSIP
jgi:molybdopterin-guanine dinucleotide biosynthesis protein A